MSTVWGDDKRFVSTYWSSVPDQQVYSTFDWGIQDEDGYVTILGRTDDVINVAGHRLGTREIEEALSSHAAVAEVAVVGVADALKGQVAMAFVVLRDARRLTRTRRSARKAGSRAHGDGGPPTRRDCAAGARAVVSMLPKTRSGKLLRRAIAALAEGREPGDLPTIEDPARVAAGARGAGGGCSRLKRSAGLRRRSPANRSGARLQKPRQNRVRIRAGDLREKRRRTTPARDRRRYRKWFARPRTARRIRDRPARSPRLPFRPRAHPATPRATPRQPPRSRRTDRR